MILIRYVLVWFVKCTHDNSAKHQSDQMYFGKNALLGGILMKHLHYMFSVRILDLCIRPIMKILKRKEKYLFLKTSSNLIKLIFLLLFFLYLYKNIKIIYIYTVCVCVCVCVFCN